MAAQLPLYVCVCERVFKYIFMNTKIPTAAAEEWKGSVGATAMTAIRAFNTWHHPQALLPVLISIARSICMPGHVAAAAADLARQFSSHYLCTNCAQLMAIVVPGLEFGYSFGFGPRSRTGRNINCILKYISIQYNTQLMHFVWRIKCKHTHRHTLTQAHTDQHRENCCGLLWHSVAFHLRAACKFIVFKAGFSCYLTVN